MSKRILFLLIVIFALFLPAAAVHADSGFAVLVEETRTPVPGENFTVDVELSGNPGITGFQIVLGYDSSVMTLNSASFADFLDDAGIKCTRSGNTLTVTADQPVARNGVWVTLTFRLNSGAALGNYPIKVSAGSSGIVGANGDRLSPRMTAGGVRLEHFHEYDKTVIKPTCSSEGYTEYYCPECGATYISDYVAKTAHTWKNQTTAAATCTRPATLTHECQVCGEVETVETSPMLGHSYIKEVVEPTCAKEGYTLYQCERCDESYQDNIVPVVDHRYTKTYGKEATCAETGYDLYACVFCGISYQLAVPTLEHRWEVQAVEPTHTHGGWSLYTCSACGLSMRGDFTDALEYDLVYTVELEPTCTHTGSRIGVCADGCGYTVREELPMLEHSYGDWEQLRSATVYRTGLWRTVCADCGHTIETKTPKLSDTAVPAEEVDLFSLTFWRGVLDRMFSNLTVLITAGAVIFLLFLLIVILKIRRRIRRKRDTTLADLEKLADGIEESPPADTGAPENIGDEFCHDYRDFGLPEPSVIAEAHRIINEAEKPETE